MERSTHNIVCECHRITEQELITVIHSGVHDFAAVQHATKVGTGCHKCIPRVMALIRKHTDTL